MMWGIIALLVLGLFNLFQNPSNTTSRDLPFSTFVSEVDNGNVTSVDIRGSEIQGTFSNGTRFKTYSPNYPELVQKLTDKGVAISAGPSEDNIGMAQCIPSVCGMRRLRFMHVNPHWTNWACVRQLWITHGAKTNSWRHLMRQKHQETMNMRWIWGLHGLVSGIHTHSHLSCKALAVMPVGCGATRSSGLCDYRSKILQSLYADRFYRDQSRFNS